MSKASGLLDEQMRMEKLSKKQDPLKQLSLHIDFAFFRKPLTKFFAYTILDRLRFMRLGINDPVPDTKTIWLFRDKLTCGGMTEKQFTHLDIQLNKDGIIAHNDELVDASIVEVNIQRNRKKTRIRARVEHIFAFMTNRMNRMYLHYRNIVRNSAAIGLMNLTYNLFRLVQLKAELKN